MHGFFCGKRIERFQQFVKHPPTGPVWWWLIGLCQKRYFSRIINGWVVCLCVCLLYNIISPEDKLSAVLTNITSKYLKG